MINNSIAQNSAASKSRTFIITGDGQMHRVPAGLTPEAYRSQVGELHRQETPAAAVVPATRTRSFIITDDNRTLIRVPQDAAPDAYRRQYTMQQQTMAFSAASAA